MTYIRNNTILITGGASGIGKLMGQMCLNRGASRLIIWDINSEMLQEVADALTKEKYTVSTYQVDVADPEQVQQAAAHILGTTGAPDIIINNAGVVVGKTFWEHSYLDIQRTMNINALGVMYVAKAFLPDMLSRGSGHIVNIASAAGLLPNPRMSVYASSKWAVIGWSESLRLELEEYYPAIHVTTVTPSYIDTGMFGGVKAPLLTPLLKPEKMAAAVLDAVEKNKILLRKPSIVYLLPILRGILPTRVFDFLIGRLFKIYTSMEHFAGRPAADAVPTSIPKT
ncbi:SDR family oxidoreductase [Pontibacter sp. MBLB2868]|uniref:SDR family oxidoreductase n=1 Tax=Pontibacter sp. MBLB2868 TaxID=3451555 RepID=UPI003F74D794